MAMDNFSCIYTTLSHFRNANVNNVQICLINFSLRTKEKELILDARHESSSSQSQSFEMAFYICFSIPSSDNVSFIVDTKTELLQSILIRTPCEIPSDVVFLRIL